MSDENILPKLKSFIGYEEVFSDGYPIEEGMIRRFAEAIGDNNPLYRDKEFARKSPFGGIVAPPLFVFEWDHHEAVTVDEKGLYISDMPLPNLLVRGGNDYEFIQPLRPGDIITTRSKVADVYEKPSRSGGNLIFVILKSTYTNQRNEVLGIQQTSFIILPEKKGEGK